PSPGRGFNSPRLSLSPSGIADALGLFPFVAAAGNISPANGVMDTNNNNLCGEVSYGLMPLSVALDPDGPDGPMPAQVMPLQALLGINSSLVSGLGNPFEPGKSPLVPPNGSFTYTRRIYLGERNDIAAVSDTLYTNLFTAKEIGTLTGDIDAVDTADV